MRKFGTVLLKDTNQVYEVVWYGSKAGFERLDVIEDISEYNETNTSNCIASYYKKQQEKYYGDTDLIKRIFRNISEASTFRGESRQEIDVKEGNVEILQLNENEALGYKCFSVMVRGLYERQYYETPDMVIDYDLIESNVNNEASPINMPDYVSFGLVDAKVIRESSSGDYYSEEYLRAKYPLEHMDDYDIVVVDSMEMALKRLEQFKNAPTKVKAVDLETTGLEWFMYGKDVIVGIVLSWNENEGTYYPFRQEAFKYNLPISFMQTILDVVNDQPSDVMIIGHNAKVEKQGIWKEDVNYVGNSDYAREWDEAWLEHALVNPNLRIDGDSMLLSILCNPVFKKGVHSLKSLAYRIRGKFFLELQDIFKDKKNIKFNILPENMVKLYACMDTANTIAVWNHLIKKLPPDEMGILALESRMVEITAANEFYGMRTRTDVLVKSLENEEYKVKMLGDMFREIHKTSANINSNNVRRDIFYNKLRCPVEVKTKTGAPSTSNVALKRIVELGTKKEYDENRVPADIVDMNNAVVVKGTALAANRYPSLVILEQYAKSMKELGAFRRIERKSVRGRVMFSLNQAGAATGRATSDAHQYSDGMKKLIVADSDDYYLWSADFKQIELRILAYLAGQEDLIELERNPDVDIHRAVLSIITKKPIWAISAEERKKGKSTNFGVVYMMSAFGLAKKNAGPAYTDGDLIEAMQSINGFYNGLPKIKEFVHSNEVSVKKNGYMKTKFKRYRYFKEILDPTLDPKSVASKVRAANNTPVQGFGADYLKIVQCNINDYIKKKGWDKKVESDGVMLPLVRIMLPIHDEVLVSSHKSIPHEEIITMFKVCMEMKINGAPPFFSAPAMVNSWYDGKLDKYEIDLRFRDQIVEAWDNGKTRLLHAESFCDEFDYLEVREIKKFCKRMRTQHLKDRKLQDITDDECMGIANSLESSVLEKLKKHFISKEEIYSSEDDYTVLTIKRMLDAEFSPYLEDLARFRVGRLQKYMDDLICKYKTPEEVAAHVDHPELTHTLISVEIKKGEKFEHVEAIKEAVKRYMEKNEVKAADMKSLMLSENADKLEDREILRDFGDLEQFMQFDENGEVIEDEDEESEEDDLMTVTNNSSTVVERIVEQTYCTYLLDEILIDLTDFNNCQDKAEEVNINLAKMSNKNGPYRAVYLIKGRALKTNLYFDPIHKEIDRVIKAVKEAG